jgi:hypothetical protein
MQLILIYKIFIFDFIIRSSQIWIISVGGKLICCFNLKIYKIKKQNKTFYFKLTQKNTVKIMILSR